MASSDGNVHNYFDGIIGERAMGLTEEQQLAGMSLVSVETQDDLLESDINTYVNDNFAGFLRFLRFLTRGDQDLLLGYYLLNKSQNALAVTHNSTQTICSWRIRIATKKLCAFIMFGGKPTEEQMKPILVKAGLELSAEVSVELSALIFLYALTRNFQTVADHFHIHRPSIRRAMKRASQQLLGADSNNHSMKLTPTSPHETALGAYIYGLLDKANCRGAGLTEKFLRQQVGAVRFKDPAILDQFVIEASDPNYDHILSPRANH
jgi:hypothetical protein